MSTVPMYLFSEWPWNKQDREKPALLQSPTAFASEKSGKKFSH